MVKPAEGYAKTTDTLLKQYGSIEPIIGDFYHYTATLHVDVLRDVDDSFITIYNGDMSLLTVPCSASTEVTVIEIELSYDELYNIYAVYEGNKKCLGSTSQPIEIFEENPNIMEAVLEFSDGNLQYRYTDGSIDIPIALEYYQEGVVIDDDFDAVDVDVYVDGEKLDDPVSVVCLGGASTIGLTNMEKVAHDINCVFGGGEIISSASVEETISHGIKWDISVNDNGLYNVPLSFNIHISDYIGSSNLDAYFDEGDEGEIWVSPAPQSESRSGSNIILLDSNYNAVHEFTWAGTGTLETNVRFNIDNSGYDYIDVPIRLVGVNEFYVSVPKSPLFYGSVVDILGKVSLSDGGSFPDGLTVTCLNDSHVEPAIEYEEGDVHTIYAYRDYLVNTPVGQDLFFECGGVSNTVHIPVYWQYWVLGRPDYPNSRNISSNYCALIDLSAGHQLKNSSVYNNGTLYFNLLLSNGMNSKTFDEYVMSTYGPESNVITTMDFILVSQTNKAYNTIMDYALGSVKNGSKVRIRYDRKLQKYTLAINGNDVWSKSNSNGNQFYIHIGKNGHLNEMIFKDVQISKIIQLGGE